jgi:hypothetical protein
VMSVTQQTARRQRRTAGRPMGVTRRKKVVRLVYALHHRHHRHHRHSPQKT